MAHIYTANAHVAGGRTGHGSTSDGKLDLSLSRPGSNGEGTNPEQLFAIAYGACFEGALATVARRQRVDVGLTSIESSVELHSAEDGSFYIEAALDVTLPAVEDPNLALALVLEAHRVCPYSNALRGNVAVVLTANGSKVATND
ncbi:Ohr subfamily peroxiredoxin [Glaciihabitans tibetensis]|uniref:Ohr subfamily peroxiredoxin n=1 Tax=Glaciihabitans tibetensis TaxID=1266600 RepID=A0A2T0VK75_9MICO|nr:Ohr family peroxiredoxin [Glaciihabitans tibetensis]PRY70525.1 Ohr subfamily peroxiredoxin [Glaciihabitans tibetensis]